MREGQQVSLERVEGQVRSRRSLGRALTLPRSLGELMMGVLQSVLSQQEVD